MNVVGRMGVVVRIVDVQSRIDDERDGAGGKVVARVHDPAHLADFTKCSPDPVAGRLERWKVEHPAKVGGRCARDSWGSEQRAWTDGGRRNGACAQTNAA
jgi:hypothetical protein